MHILQNQTRLTFKYTNLYFNTIFNVLYSLLKSVNVFYYINEKKSLLKKKLLTVYIPVFYINIITSKTYPPLVIHQLQSKSLTSKHC